MCGIAGWLDRYEDLSEKTSIIERMSQTLEKRGPDFSGPGARRMPDPPQVDCN